MTAADHPCALCALPVGKAPLTLEAQGATLLFCCEGCRGIWLMLHDVHDAAPPAPADRRPRS